MNAISGEFLKPLVVDDIDKMKTWNEVRRTCTKRRKIMNEVRRTCTNRRKIRNEVRRTCTNRRKIRNEVRRTCTNRRKIRNEVRRTCTNRRKIRNEVRRTCTNRRKISLLKDLKVRMLFEVRVADVGAPYLWGHFKDGVLLACDEVCRRKRGRRSKGDTWRWDED